MQINSRAKLILLVLVLIVLVGASGFIAWSISQSSQAPDDASAGGGGGECVWGGTNAVGSPGERISRASTDVCCNNLGWFEGGSGDTSYCEYNPNGQLCSNGATVPTAGSCASGQYVGAGSSGSACSGSPGVGKVWIATNIAGDGTGDFCCIQQPIGQCYWFQGNSLNCDCGCPSQEQFCAGKTGVQSGTCTNCGNAFTYDCGSTPPPSSYCGDGNVDSGEQCDPPGSTSNGQTCNDQCQYDDDPPPPPPPPEDTCGDAVCDSGEVCELSQVGGNETRLCEGVGNPPGGAVVTGCDLSTCTYTPPAGEQALTVVKDVDSVCQADGGQTLNYTIIITNIGDVDANYESVLDALESAIDSGDIINVSGGGVVLGNTINWESGVIAVGESLTLTYTLDISSAEAATLGGDIENTVTVIYDPDNTKEVSFTNREALTCSIIVLPPTGISDYVMYYVAFGLLALAGLVYHLKFGNSAVAKLLNTLQIRSVPLTRHFDEKSDQKKFERDMLDE